ncbi:hypothetical protein [Candidatus Sororendozoicomonas aggregata]|uniref:hypothetical protein n=1 Tax=Candidatus Sororendozoicomonas aggregata TaxID=3073239 RepID=UPI002ED57C92
MKGKTTLQDRLFYLYPKQIDEQQRPIARRLFQWRKYSIMLAAVVITLLSPYPNNDGCLFANPGDSEDSDSESNFTRNLSGSQKTVVHNQPSTPDDGEFQGENPDCKKTIKEADKKTTSCFPFKKLPGPTVKSHAFAIAESVALPETGSSQLPNNDRWELPGGKFRPLSELKLPNISFRLLTELTSYEKPVIPPESTFIVQKGKGVEITWQAPSEDRTMIILLSDYGIGVENKNKYYTVIFRVHDNSDYPTESIRIVSFSGNDAGKIKTNYKSWKTLPLESEAAKDEPDNNIKTFMVQLSHKELEEIHGDQIYFGFYLPCAQNCPQKTPVVIESFYIFLTPKRNTLSQSCLAGNVIKKTRGYQSSVSN